MGLKGGSELDARPTGRKDGEHTCTFGPTQAQDLEQVTQGFRGQAVNPGTVGRRPGGSGDLVSKRRG